MARGPQRLNLTGVWTPSRGMGFELPAAAPLRPAHSRSFAFPFLWSLPALKVTRPSHKGPNLQAAPPPSLAQGLLHNVLHRACLLPGGLVKMRTLSQYIGVGPDSAFWITSPGCQSCWSQAHILSNNCVSYPPVYSSLPQTAFIHRHRILRGRQERVHTPVLQIRKLRLREIRRSCCE